ncbi:MAG: response regulator transcription factor [Paracoccaceae bacterium]|nr:response regulator transcription factor [Paracoccaceae bacterium]
MTRVLIVEDDEDIASVLCRGLAGESFTPQAATDPAGALVLLREGDFDAAIIDRMLGEDSGLDLLRLLRGRGVQIPVIMLSALSRVEERAEGLAAGADDYVVKPFELAELVARLRVQLARARAGAPLPGFAGLTLNLEMRLAIGGGRQVQLTEREAEMLAYLIGHAGRVVTRSQLFAALWVSHGGAAENVVDVYIGYLRRKLAPLGDFGIRLRTLRGRGFILENEQ